MSAQAAIAAKTAVTAISITGAALSINPRGKDAAGVLAWIAPGATALDDVKVDFSYRLPTGTRKSVKSLLRVLAPKTYTDSTTLVVTKMGDNVLALDGSFLEAATSTERQKVLDIFTSVVSSAEFRAAFISGDVMY